MKEFIIKNDSIHLTKIENKEIKKDFDFITNDDKNNVKVTSSLGGGRFGRSWPKVEYTVKKEIVSSDIDQYDLAHRNYLNYLDDAYSDDCGIIIRPDFIWFTILCEIASMIKKDPEKFRQYFSDAPEKQKISFHFNENGDVPIDDILFEVMKKIPSNITEDLIVPDFTTLDEKSKFAFKCAFLDTVSPFFALFGLWCGYNKIKVLGEKSDYLLISKTLKKLNHIIPELKDYYDKCKSVIDDIISNWDDSEFWKNICKTDSGYGSRKIDGWFIRFFLAEGNGQLYYQLDDFPEHLAKVDYTDVENDQDYTMYVGILSSKLEDGYLIPDFNKIIAKKI
jgi:hypothetical protein